MFGRRPKTGGEQAIEALQERGVVATQIGYTQFPWNIHPRDQRIRVVPSGPFDQAWQGIQKENLISRVGTKRSSQYGATPRFLQEINPRTSRVLLNNLGSTAQSSAGPGAIAEMTTEYQQTGQPVSFKQMVFRKMMGG